MPIYEYHCKDCGTKFEMLRAMSLADEKIACKSCNSLHTNRVLSVFNAKSEGKTITTQSCSCGNCSGGSCAGCGSSN